jgi:signal transduction histidine kinase
VATLLVSSVATATPGDFFRGLPFIRFYSFEEIGHVTHASRLAFDPFSRLAIVQDGAFVVLNDSAWINRARPVPGEPRILCAVADSDGTLYYGALSSWGVVTATPSGHLRATPIVPPDLPAWVLRTNFVEILCHERGVFFAGWGGIVFWDRTTREQRFFEFEALVRLFLIGDAVYASSHNHGVRRIDPDRGVIEDSVTSAFGAIAATHAITLESGDHLITTAARRLLLLREGKLSPWPAALARSVGGPITALRKLQDGHVALAIGGVGVYVTTDGGEIRAAITSPDYHRVVDLAQNEPGVLWIAAERGVSKVLYGSPVSLVGQPLGLPVNWPQLVSWKRGLVIASSGRLYEPTPSTPDYSSRFRLVEGQPEAGTWAIAAPSDGNELLVGNAYGVFSTRDGDHFERILPLPSVARLAMTGSDLCFVIGTQEIAVLRRGPDGWEECAARVPGIGYPYIVHATRHSAWLELGANRAARVTLHDGRIDAQVFDTFPWTEPHWINVSVVDDTVMLSGAERRWIFVDEESGAPVTAPDLANLIARAPHPIVRLRLDAAGTYWCSYDAGVFAARRTGDDLVIDTGTFDIVAERTPLVQILAGGDTWISTGESLYHVEARRPSRTEPAFRPVLVSMVDRRTSDELLTGHGATGSLGELPYARNSLELTFFSGAYGTRRPPAYEMRLNGEAWSPLGPSASNLTLSDLREGRHSLDVRLVDSRGIPGEPVSFDLHISPPWYRSAYSVAAYAIALGTTVFGLVRFFLRRAEVRNRALEGLVAERTKELTATMQRLQQETEISATLAERNRLADEIHDSLEQGFTGLTFQLETTAGFPTCPPEVRAGLTVALNMAAFSRNEVRNAVHNLHSPMLDSGGLETALGLLAAQSSHEDGHVVLTVEGERRRLSSTLEHHLLRIAQEAVANAVKHAAARHIGILLAYRPAELELSISDDGRGFDVAAAEARGIGHFGLPSLRSRAAKIGGVLTLASTHGRGTRLSIRVANPDSSQK